jgi:hypothetical protein
VEFPGEGHSLVLFSGTARGKHRESLRVFDGTLGQESGASYCSPVAKWLQLGSEGWGATPLLCAAQAGKLAVLQWLLTDGGSSAHETTQGGASALMCAAMHGHLDVIQWLCTEGATLDETLQTYLSPSPGGPGLHAWQLAADHGHAEVAQWLLTERCRHDSGPEASMRTHPILGEFATKCKQFDSQCPGGWVCAGEYCQLCTDEMRYHDIFSEWSLWS